MAVDLRGAREETVEVVGALDAALQGSTGSGRLASGWGDRVEAAARALRRAGAREELAGLRLRESLVALAEGMDQRAMKAAREAWSLVSGCQPGDIQALALTQVAACHRRLGRPRGAVEAARRAEALLLAAVGDAVPQVLAVRAQLAVLMEEAGMDPTPARRSLEHGFLAMERRVRDPEAARRLLCFRRAFLDAADPPTWALLYHSRWKPVHGS